MFQTAITSCSAIWFIITSRWHTICLAETLILITLITNRVTGVMMYSVWKCFNERKYFYWGFSIWDSDTRSFVICGDNEYDSIICIIKGNLYSVHVCGCLQCDPVLEVSILMILSCKLIPLLNLFSVYPLSLPLSKFSICSDQHSIHWFIHSFIQDGLTLH